MSVQLHIIGDPARSLTKIGILFNRWLALKKLRRAASKKWTDN